MLAQACVGRGRRSREVGHPPPAYIAHGARAEDRLQHRDVVPRLRDLAPALLPLCLACERLLAAGEDDEVAQKDAVRAEVADHRGRILCRAGDEARATTL